MTISRNVAVGMLAALLFGILGAMTPGLYADWAFVRNVRTQQENQLEQRVKALTEENAKLKAAQGRGQQP